MNHAWARPTREGPDTVLVTGGAGFIGSCFLNRLVPEFPEIRWLNVDKLTYAGNLQNVRALEGAGNYAFFRLDVADRDGLFELAERERPTWIVHFAAETHVDRSIAEPATTIETNLLGTFHLLEAARRFGAERLIHVGTDEVFGSLGPTGRFDEASRYDPSSPYSASKAGADHLVRAWHRTYGLDTRLTAGANTYGPRQFPEKLIPHMILAALAGDSLPLYGDGGNVRDWIAVEDHCRAIWSVACEGRPGASYAVGGGAELSNLDVVRAVCAAVAEQTGAAVEPLLDRIVFVKDRPGHDRRYATDAARLARELGWRPLKSFAEGLAETVAWYLANPTWVEAVRSGAYREWAERHYGPEGAAS